MIKPTTPLQQSNALRRQWNFIIMLYRHRPIFTPSSFDVQVWIPGAWCEYKAFLSAFYKYTRIINTCFLSQCRWRVVFVAGVFTFSLYRRLHMLNFTLPDTQGRRARKLLLGSNIRDVLHNVYVRPEKARDLTGLPNSLSSLSFSDWIGSENRINRLNCIVVTLVKKWSSFLE